MWVFSSNTNSEEARELALIIAPPSRTIDNVKRFSPLPELPLFFRAARFKNVFCNLAKNRGSLRKFSALLGQYLSDVFTGIRTLYSFN